MHHRHQLPPFVGYCYGENVTQGCWGASVCRSSYSAAWSTRSLKVSVLFFHFQGSCPSVLLKLGHLPWLFWYFIPPICWGVNGMSDFPVERVNGNNNISGHSLKFPNSRILGFYFFSKNIANFINKKSNYYSLTTVCFFTYLCKCECMYKCVFLTSIRFEAAWHQTWDQWA